MTDTLRVTVFDYGAGNLHSLVKALEHGSVRVHVESDARVLTNDTDALVLPGVGAFAHAAQRLAPGREAVTAALRNGLPALGICLGMQLLFDASDEGEGQGLGLVGGRVTKLTSVRVPQIGWNTVEWGDADTAAAPAMAYFANSFVCRPDAASLGCVTAWTEHDDDRFPAAVQLGETLGTQFHPEKSSEPGVRFLHRFLDRARSVRARQSPSETSR